MMYYFVSFMTLCAQYIPSWIDVLIAMRNTHFGWFPNMYIFILVGDILSGVHIPTLAAMLVVVAIVLLYAHWTRVDASKIPPQFLRQAYFFFNFRDFFQVYFPKQLDSTELEITLCVEEMLQDDCPYASVLPLIAKSRALPTAWALSHLVAWSAHSSFVCPHVRRAPYAKMVLSGIDYTSYYHHSAQLQRDMMERIRRYRVVVIKDFQAMEPRCAAIVRRVADLGEAPYKQAIIILIVNVTTPTITEKILRENHASDVLELFFVDHWAHILDEAPLQDILRVMGKHAVKVEQEPDQILRDVVAKLNDPDYVFDGDY